MRILFVQRSLSPPGGGNAVAAWMLHALAPGHHVTTVTEAPWSPAETNAFYGSTIPESVERIVTPHYRWFSRFDDGRLTSLRMALVLRRARVAARRYDLAITADNFAAFPIPGLQYVHFPAPIRPSRSPLVKRYFDLCDRLSGAPATDAARNITIVNSAWTRDRLLAFGEVPHAAIVYPPVIDPGTGLPWRDRDDVFLCVGRFHPSKRIETVISIVARVREHVRPNARLLIVGSVIDRNYASRLRQLAAPHTWIEFRDDLSRAEINRLMGRSKYGIHAMIDEHFGMAVAEMARAGCMVFAHDSGGVPEVLGGERAVLWSTEDDAVSLIAASRGEEVAARLREHAAAFSPQAFTARFLKIVDQTMSGGGIPDRS